MSQEAEERYGEGRSKNLNTTLQRREILGDQVRAKSVTDQGKNGRSWKQNGNKFKIGTILDHALYFQGVQGEIPATCLESDEKDSYIVDEMRGQAIGMQGYNSAQAVKDVLESRRAMLVDRNGSVRSGESRVSGPNIYDWAEGLWLEDGPVHNPTTASVVSKQSTGCETPTTSVISEQLTGCETPTTLIGRDRALSINQLRVRYVSQDPTSTRRSISIKEMFRTAPSHCEDTSGLNPLVRRLLDKCPNDDTLAEELLDLLNSWNSGRHLPSVTNCDFDLDKALCKNSEAKIQRTLLMYIINRGQLHDCFDFNCDGQWNLDMTHRLPVSGRITEIELPRPNLAMFFKLASLTGNNPWAPYPPDMSQYLHPDGGDVRCFPFFVTEVYGAETSRGAALQANLHSASQSLHNIYKWMILAGDKDVFFEKVQVYSIVLNAEDISLRMHWAEPEEDDRLSFWFDDIRSINGYRRDEACQLVHKVKEYAKKELHSVLQKTFQHVSQQEETYAPYGIQK